MIENFEKKIGYVFKNKDLLQQALTHRSYLNENPNFPLDHNERLEFLGDAVLELAVTDYLFSKYPKKQEGELTAYRAGLVNAEVLAEIGRDLKMDEFLLLSRGEARDTGKARRYILANTIEAIIGAIYLDSGFTAANNFIHKFILPKLPKIINKGLWRDPKSFVQEMAQEHLGITPSYKIIKESGPDHAKTFVAGIYFNDTLVAKGKGQSKQEAETMAARQAIKNKNWH